jgi:hypothetical protein
MFLCLLGQLIIGKAVSQEVSSGNGIIDEKCIFFEVCMLLRAFLLTHVFEILDEALLYSFEIWKMRNSSSLFLKNLRGTNFNQGTSTEGKKLVQK